VIPVLLIQDGGLVKTVNFADPKYVGDPLNAVRIFNEKAVDELIVLDIDATSHGREPNYQLIAQLAEECRMPLCYGGGVSKLDHFQRIIELGVEKVAVSSAATTNLSLISEAAGQVGSQSVVVVIDVMQRGGRYEVMRDRGRQATGMSAADFALQCESAGAGEIVLQSVDRDGGMQGYDLQLLRAVKERIHIPLTALGGAGKLEHISELFNEFGIIGASAGSLFVFKGQYRAVLINYPRREEKQQLFGGLNQ
jgi:cyclase